MSDPRDEKGFANSDLISMGSVHTPRLMELVKKTNKISQIDVNRFYAILVAGGQAPMFTFDKAFDLHKKFVEFYYAPHLPRAERE